MAARPDKSKVWTDDKFWLRVDGWTRSRSTCAISGRSHRLRRSGGAALDKKRRQIAGRGVATLIVTQVGVSPTRLLGTAGADWLVEPLAAGIAPAHRTVRLHFHPFGGLARTVDWIGQHDRAAHRGAAT